MSAASLFLSSNYGQYVSILEAELAKGGLSPAQQVAFNSNIAAAQFGKYDGTTNLRLIPLNSEMLLFC